MGMPYRTLVRRIGVALGAAAVVGLVLPLSAHAGAAGEGTFETATLRVQGLHRTVSVYRPKALAARPALIIALHGSGGDGRRFRQLTGGAFDRLADRHGLLIAYPDALGGQWHDCRAAAPYHETLAGVDDAAFLRAVTSHAAGVTQRQLADVFAVGYSNGGHMVFRLAMESPGDYAAFAAIGANLPIAAERDCADARSPVPMMLVGGTADEINPWSGGTVRAPGGTSPGRVISAEGTAAHFRNLAGMAGAPSESALADRYPGDGTRIESRTWYLAGRPQVVLMKVAGGGHTLPSPSPAFPAQIVGPTSRDTEGAAAIWNFFSQHLARD